MRLLTGLVLVAIFGGLAAVEVAVRAAARVVANAWWRWQDRRYDKRWGLGSYYPTDDDEPCFQLTPDDLAELDRIGIAWEIS